MENCGSEGPRALPRITQHLVQRSALSCQTPDWKYDGSRTKQGTLVFLRLPLNQANTVTACHPSSVCKEALKHYQDSQLSFLSYSLSACCVLNIVLIMPYVPYSAITLGGVGIIPGRPARLRGGPQSQVCVCLQIWTLPAKRCRPASQSERPSPSDWASGLPLILFSLSLFADNSDLIACTVITKDGGMVQRFLAVDIYQMSLVEPDVSRLGWGVVKFAGLLQV